MLRLRYEWEHWFATHLVEHLKRGFKRIPAGVLQPTHSEQSLEE
jgi:hypothetical protein